jgi:hypothetical protein
MEAISCRDWAAAGGAGAAGAEGVAGDAAAGRFAAPFELAGRFGAVWAGAEEAVALSTGSGGVVVVASRRVPRRSSEEDDAVSTTRAPGFDGFLTPRWPCGAGPAGV